MIIKTFQLLHFLLVLLCSKQLKFPKENLIAYYPFNSNAKDESGNGNHGIVSGPSLTNDRFNQPNSAYLFNRDEDFIEIKDSKSLNPENLLTIAFWAKFKGTPKPGWSLILQKGGYADEGGIQREYSIWWNNWEKYSKHSFNMMSAGDNSTNQNIWFNVNFNDDWNFYSAVMDRKIHVASLYQNGTLKIKQNDGYSTFSNQGNSLFIGKGYGEAMFANSFGGAIDDVRIQSRALSNEEIWLLYKENNQSQPEEKIDCAIKIWNYSFNQIIEPTVIYSNFIHQFELREQHQLEQSTDCQIKNQLQIQNKQTSSKTELVNQKQESNTFAFSLTNEQLLNAECSKIQLFNQLNITCLFVLDYLLDNTIEKSFKFNQNFWIDQSKSNNQETWIYPDYYNKEICWGQFCSQASNPFPAKLCTNSLCNEFNNLKLQFKKQEIIYLKLEIPQSQFQIIPNEVYLSNNDAKEGKWTIQNLSPRSQYNIEKNYSIVKTELALPINSGYFHITCKMNDSLVIFYYPFYITVPFDPLWSPNWKNVWLPIVWLAGNSLFALIVYFFWKRNQKRINVSDKKK